MKKLLQLLLLGIIIVNTITTYPYEPVVTAETCTELEHKVKQNDKKDLDEFDVFARQGLYNECKIGCRADLDHDEIPTPPFTKRPSPPPDFC